MDFVNRTDAEQSIHEKMASSNVKIVSPFNEYSSLEQGATLLEWPKTMVA
jgi:hypothetical protein